MAAYLDCFSCACLIRASEPSCPFCGASQRVVSAAPSRLGLGLVLGLGLAMFGCVEDEDPEDTAASMSVGNDSQEADAVTYAGPDESTSIGDASTTTGDGTTTSDGTTTTTNDSQEADAVTYAGPDESSSTTGG